MKNWRRKDNAIHNGARVRRYRARHRSLGLCVQCPNPVTPPYSRCPECREKSATHRRATRRYGISLPLARELGLNLKPRTKERVNADR